MEKPSSGAGNRSVPIFARAVMVFQALAIASFWFWMFKEYSSNPFLQDYVRNTIPIDSLQLLLVGLCGLAAVCALAYSRKPRGQGRSHLQTAPVAPQSLAGNGQVVTSVVQPIQAAILAQPVSAQTTIPEEIEPPALRRVETHPGLTSDRSGPRPFPVIVRLEPPENDIEDTELKPRQVTGPPVLKRIAPTQETSGLAEVRGGVRRVVQEPTGVGRKRTKKEPAQGSAKQGGEANSVEPSSAT